MQNSDIKGARYPTDAGKAEFQRRQTARAFVAHLERVTRGEASAKDWPLTQRNDGRSRESDAR
ncbi:hypothetical protein PHYC_02352 [Phycisphaerales bacterium]|nr:hypothetical protein PHYC_02352 [Phycisphaerales bacterium]